VLGCGQMIDEEDERHVNLKDLFLLNFIQRSSYEEKTLAMLMKQFLMLSNNPQPMLL